MHLSRMRTVRCSGRWGRCLPQCMLGYVYPGEGVCPSACWDMSAWGGCLPQCMLGYVCLGVSAPVHAGIHPPVNRMTDRQV